jgi:hypothetical protein
MMVAMMVCVAAIATMVMTGMIVRVMGSGRHRWSLRQSGGLVEPWNAGRKRKSPGFA